VMGRERKERKEKKRDQKTNIQNPATDPNPASRPAQAFPASCSVGGRVSTRRARSAAITTWGKRKKRETVRRVEIEDGRELREKNEPALTEKSTKNTEKMAMMILNVMC